LTAQSQQNDSVSLLRDMPMGFGVGKYADFAAYVAHLERLRRLYPDRFAYHTDRKTFGGDYDLYWLTVGDTHKPAILFTSVLHARYEWKGAHLIMRLVEKLLDPADNQAIFNARFLNDFCLVGIPMVNTWGYFACAEGKHYNNHPAPVPELEKADWHDMTHYREFRGVNLNRNFDWNWNDYPNLPFSVRSYWNGRDYGFANYFMMPYVLNERGEEIYDPENKRPNHLLKPDPDIYDYKGEAAFSEPETRLILDLFKLYRVVGFGDWHIMNPWQTNNTCYISRAEQREVMMSLVNEGVARLNRRHPDLPAGLPQTSFQVMEEYDNSAPYSVNWAQNRMGVRSFSWETGTDFPEEVWTDAYLEILYRTLCWLGTPRDGSGAAPGGCS